MSLTLDQVHAAQRNDLPALTAVISAMEDRISRIARFSSGRLDGDHREDFEQDAREALFLALPRFTGSTVDSFFAFMWSSINDALKDKVRSARYMGADKDAVKVFMSVFSDADGDVVRAEQLAQTVPPKGVRLSADRARAARMAWQGTASLDAPIQGGEGETSGNSMGTLAVHDEVPQVQPKVGHGAALEALRVLARYAGVHIGRMTPRSFAANLPTLVESLEDSVTVPADATIRKYVLDAMAILRSAVSTASDGDLLEELRSVSDELRDERAVKVGAVRSALALMGEGQRLVLMHSFGIRDARDYGWGEGCDMDGLCAALGVSYANLKVQRSKARAAFAKYYIGLAARTLEEATALTEAAAAMRKPGGRK